MQAGPELAAWLRDPAAQAETTARSLRFAARVRAVGSLADCASELDRIAADRDEIDRPRRIDDALRRLLADAGWAQALVDEALAAVADDPLFEPPFAATGGAARGGLVLLDHPLAVVTLSIMTPASLAAARRAPGRRSIGFTGARSLTRFLRAGGATLTFYAAPDDGDDFRTAAAAPCRRTRRRKIADGELVAIDGRSESFAIDAIAAPALMLAAESSAGPGALTREYDAATLAFAGASAADEASSRIGLLLTLLRVVGRSDAGPLFARTIADAPFFLRWQAMRDYLMLDAAAALPLLRAAAGGDPHAEVRAAARRTLAILRVRRPALFAEARAAA